jgi:hypothetical protein
MKFSGSSGRRPAAEARRYIYLTLATILEADLDARAGWTSEDVDLNEADIRRVEKEGRKVIEELRRKAAR